MNSSLFRAFWGRRSTSIEEAGIMRVRHWILLGSVSMGLVGAALAGCGGSSDSTPATDAGADITTADVANDTAPAADTSVPPKDAAPSCVEDASIATISPPDAAIADGASSVGICLGCVKSKCSAELQDCAGDCPCNNAIEGAITCIFQGGSITTCGAPILGLPGNSGQLGFALGGCLQQSCAPECAPTLAKDAGTDAPADAPDAG
jgi:hypothetical protein